MNERQIEEKFTEKLKDLKYTHRPDIRDRAGLEQNFREKLKVANGISNGNNIHMNDLYWEASICNSSKFPNEMMIRKLASAELSYRIYSFERWRSGIQNRMYIGGIELVVYG